MPAQVAESPIAYDGSSYPYFFVDTNGNGIVDTDEAQVPNAFKSWTPRLVKATYNYQFSLKDPGRVCPQWEVRDRAAHRLDR